MAEFLPSSKVCCICSIRKPQADFSFCKTAKDGLNYRCIECQRNSRLQSKFGISIDQYNLMLKSQNGVCKICGKPETVKQNDIIKPLAVDHCHRTNKIRGLLCNKCNVLLGHAEDNSEFLRKATTYLENNK